MLPQEVAKSDRRSAWAIYLALLTLFFLYVGLTIDNRVAAQENPPRSVTSLSKQWLLPHIAFCPLKNEIDSTLSLPHDLVQDAGYTALVDPQFFDVTDPITAIQDPTNQNCAIFLTGGLKMKQKGVNQLFLAIHVRDIAETPDDFVIYAAEVRFYPVEGKWSNYTVYYIPYGTYAESFANSVTLSRTELRRLDGSVEETYAAIISSNPSRNFLSIPDGCIGTSPCAVNKTHIVGGLININGWNVEYIKEINPVNVYELIGLFGGMWGYVSLIFGLIFVSGTQIDGDKIIRWKAVAKQAEEVIAANSVLHAIQLTSDLEKEMNRAERASTTFSDCKDDDTLTIRTFAAMTLHSFCSGLPISSSDYEWMSCCLLKLGPSQDEVMNELKKLNLDDLHIFLKEWISHMNPPIYSARVVHDSIRLEWHVEFEEEVASIQLSDGTTKKLKTRSQVYPYSLRVLNVLKTVNSNKKKKDEQGKPSKKSWIMAFSQGDKDDSL